MTLGLALAVQVLGVRAQNLAAVQRSKLSMPTPSTPTPYLAVPLSVGS
jgi:hypothetical protein